MSKSLEVFCEIPCLTEKTNLFSGIALQKKWFRSADKRIIGQYLQKFIVYNSKLLDFLGVTATIVGSDQSASLTFRTSDYIGAIPLRSPDTGKQIGDFVVSPRFYGKGRYTDYIEILDLLGNTINPEVGDTLPLASGRNFRPPLYLESIKFILAIEELVRKTWRKFDRIEQVLNEPKGQVNWNKYSKAEFKIENRLRFPIGRNILSEHHDEYCQIRYVFDLCVQEIQSPNTPLRIKSSLNSRIAYLQERLYFHIPQQTREIRLHSSDSPTVRKCKIIANRILDFDLVESTAWRVDFSDVFEKFTQHIFREMAKESGGKLFSNAKLLGRGRKHFAWQLNHLEPDAIFQKEKLLLFIDAKYKSHLYNKYDSSEFLKDEHRHDLHQILAYAAFSETKTKFCFLCYPSTELEKQSLKYENPANRTTCNVIILGIPFEKDIVKPATQLLLNNLNLFQKEYSL